jgi:hypothetical protein
MSFLKEKLFTKEGLKFLISAVAAVVMAFTPSHIDAIIELVLPTIFGIDVLTLKKK